MSERHLSVDDLKAFSERRLDASRVQAIFTHLSSCAMCRARSQEALDTNRSVDRLVSDIEERKPALPRWILPLAAALAIAVIGGLLFSMRGRMSAPAVPTTTTVVHETSPRPGPADPQVPAPQPIVHPFIAEALARGTLSPPPQLAALLATPATERIRGEESGPIATYEPSRVVVAAQRPRFRFPAERGFPSIVRVFDRNREILHSEPLVSGEWTSTSDLPRGATYTWQVESTRNGEMVIAPAPPAPPARFLVLDADSFRALEDARREHPQNHLLLGVLSARAGLREEAETQLRIAARSGDPRVLALLRSVRNWPR